jgi:hypothetical protein
MPKFPGPVQHQNPGDFIVNLTENQVKGLGTFADAAARNALNANMRVNGFLAVLQDVDKLYIYNSSDITDSAWTNTSNWKEVGPATIYTAGTGLSLSDSAFSISTSYSGQASITTLGTITSGTWNGSTIALSNGGTGATTATTARGNILPSYSNNAKKILKVDNSANDAEWSLINQESFSTPLTVPSGSGQAIIYAFRKPTQANPGSWQELAINGIYNSITVADDSVVVKSINSITPTSGAITLRGTDISRSSSNTATIHSSISDVEYQLTVHGGWLKSLISNGTTSSTIKVADTTGGAEMQVTVDGGSLSKNNTGFFFKETSPGQLELKVQDGSATPQSRVAIKAIGSGSSARVGVHNINPGYPLDITGSTRVTGDIIVTGTVDGVDVSELKNTVDNITVGGTEEIELFSYFLS